MSKDNTIQVSKDDRTIDIYTHDVFYYADKYIQDNNIDISDYKTIKRVFPHMILTIHDQCIGKISTDDIELLDKLFTILLNLCIKYHYNITMFLFSLLTGIDTTTFSSWSMGEYKVSNGYSQYSKRWLDKCKECLVNDLNNNDGTSANKIFVAKAIYGLVETAPIPVKNSMQALTAQELPLLGISEETQ